MAERIGTPSRSQLKQWKKLSMAKYRRREGLFLAEGGKVVAELLGSGRPVETRLVSEESAGRWQGLLDRAPAGVSVYRLTAGEWEALSQDPSPEGHASVRALRTPALRSPCSSRTSGWVLASVARAVANISSSGARKAMSGMAVS